MSLRNRFTPTRTTPCDPFYAFVNERHARPVQPGHLFFSHRFEVAKRQAVNTRWLNDWQTRALYLRVPTRVVETSSSQLHSSRLSALYSILGKRLIMSMRLGIGFEQATHHFPRVTLSSNVRSAEAKSRGNARVLSRRDCLARVSVVAVSTQIIGSGSRKLLIGSTAVFDAVDHRRFDDFSFPLRPKIAVKNNHRSGPSRRR